jgi:hypothetical protein
VVGPDHGGRPVAEAAQRGDEFGRAAPTRDDGGVEGQFVVSGDHYPAVLLCISRAGQWGNSNSTNQWWQLVAVS